MWYLAIGLDGDFLAKDTEQRLLIGRYERAVYRLPQRVLSLEDILETWVLSGRLRARGM